MSKKQTAVQWLSSHWDKLKKDGEKMSWQQIIDITNLALQLEREQIEEAFEDGWCQGDFKSIDKSKYYTQTYE